MSDADKHKQHLYEQWIDGRLTEEQQREFMALCADDPELEARASLSLSIKGQAEQYREVPVPDWDPGAIFETNKDKKWWSWQGLPAMSFATSMLAIVMVIARVEINLQGNGLTISFGGNSQQQIEQLVNQRLEGFDLEQKNMLASFNQDFNNTQIQNNADLSRYLIQSSRTERREDFAELIKYVNQQRSDDQMFYAKQLNKLQDNILTHPENSAWDGKATDSKE